MTPSPIDPDWPWLDHWQRSRYPGESVDQTLARLNNPPSQELIGLLVEAEENKRKD